MRTVDSWLLKARCEGATFAELSTAVGWNRRTVSRYLAKLCEAMAAEGWQVCFDEASLTATFTKSAKACTRLLPLADLMREAALPQIRKAIIEEQEGADNARG